MHKSSVWLAGISIFVCTGFLSAAESYKFRVYLKDKGETVYSANFLLSSDALERKSKMGISVDETDFPVCSFYLDTLQSAGTQIVTCSKWFNTVVVEASDSLVINNLNTFAFVDSVKCVWKGNNETSSNPEKTVPPRLISDDNPLASSYGYAEKQIQLHNGIKLHEKGFRGEGIRIAVIDAGFTNVDKIDLFDSLKVAGTYNFVSPRESVFRCEDDHGTKVLSCMAANRSGIMVGTAPEAEFWLLRSEDNRSEYPVEEDYWVAAAEFADSVGVDIITSSLGYFTFDNPGMEYGKEALDGKTTLISRAAEEAVKKGILVFSSAGNEGAGEWEKMTFPADAASVITVGAVTENKSRSSFSSKGLTSDFRIKPDVAAMGSDCCVASTSGGIRYANGTSFATPILAGLGACLWQAFPELNNREIRELILRTAHQYNQPDAELGYGIPDIDKAFAEQQTVILKTK